jgi:hypothetical protein
MENTKSHSFSLDKETLELIRTQSEREGRSQNEFLSLCVQEHIDKSKADDFRMEFRIMSRADRMCRDNIITQEEYDYSNSKMTVATLRKNGIPIESASDEDIAQVYKYNFVNKMKVIPIK